MVICDNCGHLKEFHGAHDFNGNLINKGKCYQIVEEKQCNCNDWKPRERTRF